MKYLTYKINRYILTKFYIINLDIYIIFSILIDKYY